MKVCKKFTFCVENLKGFITNNYIFFISLCISSFIFTSWLIAFYPGTMSPDSIHQWIQGSEKIFDNAHPFMHTLIVISLRKIWDSPAVIALYQLLVSSFILSFTVSYLFKRDINKVLILLVFMAFISSPVIGIYNVTLWKDILYTQFIFILCMKWCIDLNKSKEDVLRNTFQCILFSLLIFITSSLRHNGIVYLIFIPFLYLVTKVINIKKFLKIMLVIAILYISFNCLLFRIVNIENDKDVGYTNAIMKVQFIAHIAKMNGNFENEETEVIEKLMPIERMVTLYHCSSGDYINFDPEFNQELLLDESYRRDFNKVANKLVLRNIPYVVSNRVCLASYMLGMHGLEYSYLYIDYIYDNDVGLYQDGNPLFRNYLTRYLNWSTRMPQRLVFWVPMVNIFIFVFYLSFSIIKKNIMLFGYVLINLINFPMLLFIGAPKDFRYLYMVYFSTFFIVPFSFLKYKQK